MDFREMDRLKDAIVNMFAVNMGLKPGETAGVFTDVPSTLEWRGRAVDFLDDACRRNMLARAVYETGSAAFPGSAFEFHPFPMTGGPGAEPEARVGEALSQVDVAVLITTFSLSHTGARMRGTRSGARIASMPRFVAEMFLPGGPMAVDYVQVAADSTRFADLLARARTATVTSDAGTDISMVLEGRPGHADTGLYARKGEWGNLPAGEAYIAPVERTARGRIVIEKGWYTRDLPENITLTVENGEVVSILGGGAEGEALAAAIGLTPVAAVSPLRRLVAELGVGTNPNARRPDITLEAEKIRGTVHVALGSNSSMGGEISADYHQDFVIPRATLVLDGEVVVDRGRFGV